jgi:hypothetical protein
MSAILPATGPGVLFINRSLKLGLTVLFADQVFGIALRIGFCTSCIAPSTAAVPLGFVFIPTDRAIAPVL